jgi:hypothetical protein
MGIEAITRSDLLVLARATRAGLLKIADHSIRHMKANSILDTLRGAMSDTRLAEHRRVHLYGDHRSGGNGSFRFHKHSKSADIHGMRPQDLISPGVLPAEIYLPLDGKTLMQPFGGGILVRRDTGLLRRLH